MILETNPGLEKKPHSVGFSPHSKNLQNFDLTKTDEEMMSVPGARLNYDKSLNGFI